MTEQVRFRIDRNLVKRAEKVCDNLGMTPTQAVRMFFAQLVKLQALPFRPSEFPALEEYGATLADAEKAETRMRNEIEADRKAGKVIEFTGKLP
jgi:addiction module RelB/DinJ family antitoxin